MPAERGPKFALHIQVAAPKAMVPRSADFKGWVRAALSVADSPAPGALGIRLVGLEEGRSLNETWRHKAGPTNVLAFPGPGVGRRAAELPHGLPAELGDLVICLPVVHEEAREQGKSPRAHLAHLVVHGTLHLLGYTHERAADATAMEALEVRALASLGYASPYAPRTK